MAVGPLPATRTRRGDAAGPQDVPSATVPADNQSFLVNTDCPVLLLLSHLRTKLGVPATGELGGWRADPAGAPHGAGSSGMRALAFPDVIDLCDKLGTPKLLFQVKTLRERASEFLPAPGTYYVCRVDLGTPGTAQEQASRTFTPLLKNPSVALTEALRQHGQHPHRRLQRSLKAAEGRRTPTTEALPAGTQGQGAVRGGLWDLVALGLPPPPRPPPAGTGTPPPRPRPFLTSLAPSISWVPGGGSCPVPMPAVPPPAVPTPAVPTPCHPSPLSRCPVAPCGKAAARGAARSGEEQEGAPRRTSQPPGGRQPRPRQR
ncbi:uncharacterized protein CXorf65 homolog [Oxyura jamaicensis]|uniref:uncharacterized protein CXorf65 homolog n=1 Tax=Oxyura jamaicensis TaxID=8884 RepID=UPI0015A5C99E|nr:uncharacterized protein CXorf65 homolog [Oxyura jamaicensis]